MPSLRYLALVGLLSVAVFGSSTVLHAEDDDCDAQQSVALHSGTGISGEATLCVTDSSTRLLAQAQSLLAGHAYTAWFIYFDNPALCKTPGKCGGADLIGPVITDPAGVFGRMDSAVAPDSGNLQFRGRLRGFHVSPGSQILLAIFDHGPASTDLKERARQLLTPESPILGAPGLGVVVQKGFPVASAAFINITLSEP